MKRYFILLFALINISVAFAQKPDSLAPVNTIFEINLRCIERIVTVNKWGIDSSYFLHYTVRNISKDTFTYVTNSCFYYNHYSLKIGKLEFDLNPSGGCMFNSTTPYALAPGESFKKSEWIIASNVNAIAGGEWDVKLLVPLVMDDETTYRVDGRPFVENEECLIFDNHTKVIETYIDNRKRKRKSL